MCTNNIIFIGAEQPLRADYYILMSPLLKWTSSQELSGELDVEEKALNKQKDEAAAATQKLEDVKETPASKHGFVSVSARVFPI